MKDAVFSGTDFDEFLRASSGDARSGGSGALAAALRSESSARAISAARAEALRDSVLGDLGRGPAPAKLVVTGTNNAEVLFGTTGNDTIFGLGGNDSLYGDDGDDILDGGSGINTIFGGLGTDTVSYANSTGSVTVDLSSGTATADSGAYASDTLFEIENIEGSGFYDNLWGNGNANEIWAGTGGAQVIAGAGDDILHGSAGQDYLDGGDDNDTILGGGGGDTIFGWYGDDFIDPGEFGSAYPYADGGTGNDILTLRSGTEGATIDYLNQWIYYTSTTGNAFYLTFLGFETVIGTHFADFFIGDTGDNRMAGAGGDDFLEGFAGSNTAVFTGNRADYVVTVLSSFGLEILDTRSQAQIDADAGGSGESDGKDTITNFQFFDFLDGTYTFAQLQATANARPSGTITVAGSPTQGQTLSVTSTLTDANGIGVFSYQWFRDGVALSGATTSTYALGQGDVGGKISVSVSYTDGAGFAESVTSAETAAVANVDDAPTGTVTVSGQTVQGQTLTVSHALNDLDGIDPNSYGYQWARDGNVISGAVGVSYTLVEADVGALITVIVSYVDGYGAVNSKSGSAPGLIQNVNDPNTGSVAITGTGQVGQTLTADVSQLNDPDGNPSSYAFQWQRNGADISGATAATYVLTAADDGATIGVVVSYTDGRGTQETLGATLPGMVGMPNLAPTGNLIITGNPVEGSTLTVDTSQIDDPNGNPASFSYQWMRDGVDIAQATGASYTLVAADVGAQLSVEVSYVDGDGYAETLTEIATTSGQPMNHPATGPVLVLGTTQVGSTLTVDTSQIQDQNGLGQSYAYRWLRDGVAILGATQASYTLVAADAGAAISARVTFTDDDGFAESLDSAATAPIDDGNDKPVGEVWIDGEAYVGAKLKAKTSDISDPDGPGKLTFSYQWLLGGEEITGAVEKTYKVTKADLGKSLKVRVTYTDAYGTVETSTSAKTEKADFEDLNEKGTDNADTWTGGGGDDTYKGKGGDDDISGSDGADTLEGGSGSDTINGGKGGDNILGGKGGDFLNGNNGTDTVYGNNGDDHIAGGKGGDFLFGEDGADTIDGNKGADDIDGGVGNDILSGNEGADTIRGGDGNDTLSGDNGTDTLRGEVGNDDLKGGKGDDVLEGGDGSDTLKGNANNDVLKGGKGADKLFGNAGDDTLRGGDGKDILDGGEDDDHLYGNGGVDTFRYNGGKDVIHDFAVGTDKLELDPVLGSFSSDQNVLKLATVTAVGIEFNFGNGNRLTLENIFDTSLLIGELGFGTGSGNCGSQEDCDNNSIAMITSDALLAPPIDDVFVF